MIFTPMVSSSPSIEWLISLELQGMLKSTVYYVLFEFASKNIRQVYPGRCFLRMKLFDLVMSIVKLHTYVRLKSDIFSYNAVKQ